ncbi:hypothetical protein [Stenotrophomonas forensis]|uniref:hypothetical protein n=1 Tax=Stenotrophomonas forensis TaxID=2871169 RepID=UPI0039C74221
MDGLEKHARELLAAEVDRDVAAMPGVEEVATSIREGGTGGVLFVPTALRAITAALAVAYRFEASAEAFVEACEVSESPVGRASVTPSAVYVLVDQAQLRYFLRDAITSVEFIAGRGQSKPLARRVSDQAWALVESIPARRKVP